MSEAIHDTPTLGRAYCPGCEPDADPLAEILDVRWCDAHALGQTGLDDGLVTISAHLLGNVEAGGEDNRRWCELFRAAAAR